MTMAHRLQWSLVFVFERGHQNVECATLVFFVFAPVDWVDDFLAHEYDDYCKANNDRTTIIASLESAPDANCVEMHLANRVYVVVDEQWIVFVLMWLDVWLL